MIDPSHPIAELLRKDRRYKFDAYVLVWESLKYAQETLGMGANRSAELEAESSSPTERHLTGQELCEAIRRYAVEQYGFMAKKVLEDWGVHSTSDFGEIVFNLIGIGQMRKTPEDRREHFDDVYDFDTAFVQDFKITMPDAE